MSYMRDRPKFSNWTPCPKCPFWKTGGSSLPKKFAAALGLNMLDSEGSAVYCYDDIREHCVGSLVFAEHNGRATPCMVAAEMRGEYVPDILMSYDHIDSVVSSVAELVEKSKDFRTKTTEVKTHHNSAPQIQATKQDEPPAKDQIGSQIKTNVNWSPAESLKEKQTTEG